MSAHEGPAGSHDIVSLHRQALAATGRLVAGVRPEHLGLPTPCEGWDVRDLLQHVVAGNLWVRPLVEGNTIDEVGDAYDGDVLGDDPAGAYERSSVDADAAFSTPGATDAACAVSYGPIPGSMYARHRFVDVLIHGWDLATAIGAVTALDPELVAACWDAIEPEMEMIRGSGAFGVQQELPPDGDPQARLLAALGRRA